MTTITIRPALPADHAAFLAMWTGLVDSDPAEPGNRAMGQANWDRIHDPANPMQVLIAADGTGTAQGFILYLAFPFSWSRGDACYLQDLFVNEDMRGQGIARSLIKALESLGRESGWYKIFWMTQAHNTGAQRLYDRVGIRRNHLRYDLPISDP